MTSPLFFLKRKLQGVRRFSKATAVKDSPFFNYPRRLSYAHGTSELPLLSEHVSERLRNITKKYPNNLALISNH
jgi:fatty-acyl-CoA synthase